MPLSARPQTPWFRVGDGKLVEHHADRDDLGQALQLGWFEPPSRRSPDRGERD